MLLLLACGEIVGSSLNKDESSWSLVTHLLSGHSSRQLYCVKMSSKWADFVGDMRWAKEELSRRREGLKAFLGFGNGTLFLQENAEWSALTAHSAGPSLHGNVNGSGTRFRGAFLCDLAADLDDEVRKKRTVTRIFMFA